MFTDSVAGITKAGFGAAPWLGDGSAVLNVTLFGLLLLGLLQSPQHRLRLLRCHFAVARYAGLVARPLHRLRLWIRHEKAGVRADRWRLRIHGHALCLIGRCYLCAADSYECLAFGSQFVRRFAHGVWNGVGVKSPNESSSPATVGEPKGKQ